MGRALGRRPAIASAVAMAAVLLTRPVSGAPPAAPGDEVIAALLEATNAQRANAGLAPLTLEPHLALAAQGYAEVLASGSCFGHACGPEPELTRRAEQVGYTDWLTLGENIAGGYTAPDAVVAGWMGSPGHRANILNPAYTEIGVGQATGGRLGVYWTEVFGARPGGTFASQALPGVADDTTAPADDPQPPEDGGE